MSVRNDVPKSRGIEVNESQPNQQRMVLRLSVEAKIFSCIILQHCTEVDLILQEGSQLRVQDILWGPKSAFVAHSTRSEDALHTLLTFGCRVRYPILG